MMATLHIQLLDGLHLRIDDSPITSIDMPRLQKVLAYLVLHRAVPSSRQQLAFLLWPDTSDTQAQSNLRTLLHRLRQALPHADAFLHTTTHTVQWQPDSAFTLDVADFEHARAQAELAAQERDHVMSRRWLTTAVGIYRGDLLPSWYDDWVLDERERLRQQFQAALERLILLLEWEGDYRTAIDFAQRLLQHDPLHEATYCQLMRLHALHGDRTAALRLYHTCATMLVQEFGAEPGPETHHAYERLLSLDTSSALPDTLRAPSAVSTVLVGRQPVWFQLQTAWQAAMTGAPQMVLLAAEAGIGKTRLVDEMLTWAGRQGIATASAHCYAAEGSLVYAPVTAWLRSGTIRPTLTTLDPIWRTDVARLVPELLVEHANLPHPGPLTERWQRRRLFEALARAILVDGQPRLLTIDDLQWCDQETLEWLHYLLHYNPQARLLLVGTLRIEQREDSPSLANFLRSLRHDGPLIEIMLSPLDASATAALATQIAGYDFPPDLAVELYQQTEGNPLFVVETLRASLTPGDWRRAPDLLSLPARAATGQLTQLQSLPPRVQAVIEARLAQLQPEARELVRLAAAIGRTFTFAVLARASDADEATLVRAVDELWQRRLVREQGVEGYDFSHDKIREVAYQGLSSVRRRVVHRRIAEALEAVYGGQLAAVSGPGPGGTRVQVLPDDTLTTIPLTAIYPLLVYHWRQAGDESKMISYLAKAGEQALHHYANQEAVQFFAEALTLDAQYGSGTDRLRRAHWEWQLGEAHLGMGHPSEGRAHLESAAALLGWPVPTAKPQQVVSVVSQVLRQALHRLWPARFLGRMQSERETFLEAARVYMRLVETYWFASETVSLAYAGLSALNLAEQAGASPELARAYAIMCLATGSVPVHLFAQAYGRRALAMAKHIDEPSALAYTLFITCVYQIGTGAWTYVRESLAEAVALFERLGEQRLLGDSLTVLSMAALYQGAFRQSAQQFASVSASSRRTGNPQHQIWGLIGEAESHFRLGHLDEAILLLDRAMDMLTEHPDPIEELRAQGLRAVLYVRRGEYVQAQQAAEIAERLIQQYAAPTVHYVLEGYAGVAEVYLALWEISEGHGSDEQTTASHRACQAVKALQHYARIFPIGAPRAWLWQGVADWLAGAPKKAYQSWQRSLASAGWLGMVYEQGLAWYEMGRHATQTERQAYLDRASAIFGRVDAITDLARAEAAK